MWARLKEFGLSPEVIDCVVSPYEEHWQDEEGVMHAPDYDPEEEGGEG